MGKSFMEVFKMGEMIEDEIKTSRIVSFAALTATTQAIQGVSGVFGGKKKKEDMETIIAGTHSYPKRPPRPYPQSQAQVYTQAPYIPPHHYYPPQNPLYSTPPPPYPVYSSQPYAQTPSYPQWRAQAPQNRPFALPNYQNPSRPNFQPRPEYKKEKAIKNKFTPLGESYASLFDRLRKLKAPKGPNINQNPLPTHAEANMLELIYDGKESSRGLSRYRPLRRNRTCCALTWVAQKLKHYLSSYTTYLISRIDPLKYIFQKPMPTGRLAKCQLLLTEFDIVYVTRTAMKAQDLEDHLAGNPIDEEYESLKTYFLDEEVSCVDEVVIDADPGWRLFFDGAVNMKRVGIGAVLISDRDDISRPRIIGVGRFGFSRPSNSRRLEDARFKAHPVSTMLVGAMSTICAGPFFEKKVLPNGALYLTDIEGKMAEMAINVDAVKRYYAVGFVEAFRFGKRVHLRGMVKWKPIVRVRTHFPQSGSGSMMQQDRASVSDLDPPENGILLYVQDPPEKWDFTFVQFPPEKWDFTCCSGPS
ncbi:hypothetical protein FXO37_11457 [Capsicum annuum]|nr:hypothetical protein FXO37_11457 [Capsicum annuum]